MEFILPYYDHTNLGVVHDIKNSQKYDFIIMGTSHAKMFAYDGHITAVEHILHKKYASIADLSSGVVPQKINLQYFYDLNNSTPVIVYFIDPWIFYSKDVNENNYYLTEEAFRFRYLYLLISNKFSYGVIREYITKKITYKFFIIPTSKNTVMNATMSKADIKNFKNAVNQRMSSWYPNGIDQTAFHKYTQEFDEILQIAQKHNTHIIFIMPPTLMGRLPGKEQVIKFIKGTQLKYHTQFYDYSNALSDRSMFLNIDHLNYKGVKFFAKKYLNPILSKSR